MNRLFKVAICVAAVWVVVIVSTVLAGVLGVETLGSTEDRIVQVAADTLLSWALLLILLKYYGAKITWPN